MTGKIFTKEHGFVESIDYRTPQRVGGSLMLALTNVLETNDTIRIIVTKKTKTKVYIVLERVNKE